MDIRFYSLVSSPRLIYIVDFVLAEVLGFRVQYVEGHPKAADGGVPSIHYGGQRWLEGPCLIPAHPFLMGEGEPQLDVVRYDGLPAFFSLPEVEGSDLPFDLFSMAFYLMSRYEEYGIAQMRDEHGRFLAKASVAAQNGFLEQPLIDQWADRLYGILRKRFPQCSPRKINWRLESTIDVDFAWAYRHKGWRRSSGGLLTDLLAGRWGGLRRRIAVWLGRQKDPFYTFEHLQYLHREWGLQPLWFVLVADHGVFDKNISPLHPAMRALIGHLAEAAEVGLHPSYASADNRSLLAREKSRLEAILRKPVTRSRQHYLRLKLPETYQQLIEAGMDEDHTMGYADAVGFRASTAHPFYWYDLEKETVTSLRIVPFQVMDVTLKNYLALEPEAATALCEALAGQIKKTGGVFSFIWHNSSFSSEMGWEGWAVVYEKLLALGSEKNNAHHVSVK